MESARPASRLLVVFDTNVYIRVGEKRIDEMSAAEAQAGVLALASVWPSLELLARCGGADTARAQRAHSALRRIVAHAGYAGPDGFRVRVHEAGEFTLAKGLFGHSLESLSFKQDSSAT